MNTEDEFYLPVFDDFEEIMERYPYVKVVNYQGEPHLGLGFVSGPIYSTRRGLKGEDARINCAVTGWDQSGSDLKEVHFRSLRGPFQALKRSDTRNKKFIKLLPLTAGVSVRSWINVVPRGVLDDSYRFGVVTSEGTVQIFRDETAMVKLRSSIREECLRGGEIGRT